MMDGYLEFAFSSERYMSLDDRMVLINGLHGVGWDEHMGFGLRFMD